MIQRMKIIRFQSGSDVFFGSPLDAKTARLLDGRPPGPCRLTGAVVNVDRLLAPIEPVDLLCIGLNYRAHADEQNVAYPQNPLLFMKARNALNDPGAPIPIPARSAMIDFECELAVIIGRAARNVPEEAALEHVFGYTLANDVSSRDWQKDRALGGGQWCRAKSFDGFCPLGPCIVTADEIPDPGRLTIRTRVNGELMQESGTDDMVFSVAQLIANLSSTMTLHPGQVILTGTPGGVGMYRDPPVWLKPGDVVSVSCDAIGELVNPVAAGC